MPDDRRPGIRRPARAGAVSQEHVDLLRKYGASQGFLRRIVEVTRPASGGADQVSSAVNERNNVSSTPNRSDSTEQALSSDEQGRWEQDALYPRSDNSPLIIVVEDADDLDEHLEKLQEHRFQGGGLTPISRDKDASTYLDRHSSKVFKYNLIVAARGQDADNAMFAGESPQLAAAARGDAQALAELAEETGTTEPAVAEALRHLQALGLVSSLSLANPQAVKSALRRIVQSDLVITTHPDQDHEET